MTFKLIADPRNDKVFREFAAMPKLVSRGIRRGAWISGQELTKDTRKRMTAKDKSGREYQIYTGIGGRQLKSPRKHTASAAGEYPAVISGKLRKSVDFFVRGNKRLEFGAGGDGVKYARALEQGNASRNLKPRKYLKQTVDRLGNKVNKNITREINHLLGIK